MTFAEHLITVPSIPRRLRAPVAASAMALVALVSVVGLLAPSTAAAQGSRAPAAQSVQSAARVEDSLLVKINNARVSQGGARLAERSVLDTVARDQARRMANRSLLFHNPELATDVPNWKWVGENVGYGPDAPTLHVAFMRSPAHRANILDRDYTEVGIGAVVVGNRVWVAEVFRRPMRTGTG